MESTVTIRFTLIHHPLSFCKGHEYGLQICWEWVKSVPLEMIETSHSPERSELIIDQTSQQLSVRQLATFAVYKVAKREQEDWTKDECHEWSAFSETGTGTGRAGCVGEHSVRTVLGVHRPGVCDPDVCGCRKFRSLSAWGLPSSKPRCQIAFSEMLPKSFSETLLSACCCEGFPHHHSVSGEATCISVMTSQDFLNSFRTCHLDSWWRFLGPGLKAGSIWEERKLRKMHLACRWAHFQIGDLFVYSRLITFVPCHTVNKRQERRTFPHVRVKFLATSLAIVAFRLGMDNTGGGGKRVRVQFLTGGGKLNIFVELRCLPFQTYPRPGERGQRMKLEDNEVIRMWLFSRGQCTVCSNCCWETHATSWRESTQNNRKKEEREVYLLFITLW